MNENDTHPQNRYQHLAETWMTIEEVTWGNEKRPYWEAPNEGFIIRLRGTLHFSAEQVQRELIAALTGENITGVVDTSGEKAALIFIVDALTPHVRNLFDIEHMQWGQADGPFICRYTGQLTQPSETAYDHLAQALAGKDITPLFRLENEKHVIILQKGVIHPTPSNPWVNVFMFGLTFLSVALVGALMSIETDATTLGDAYQDALRQIWVGWPFAVSLLSILLAHELGHYIAGKIHKTAVTLPYFLPVPLYPFGTFGAFIQLKQIPRNRRVLLDIGVAGPLAGIVVAIVVLFIGLNLSTVSPLPTVMLDPADNPTAQTNPNYQTFSLEGNSLLYLGMKYLVFGELLPAPAGESSLGYWARFILTGSPAPVGGRDVTIHPVALAGWGGIFFTGLNLIPAGQLDGGHVIYALIGRRARKLRPFILVAMILMGVIWSGWWLWAFLIALLGQVYAEPLDQITPLNPARKAVAILGLVLLVLTITPVPMLFFLTPIP